MRSVTPSGHKSRRLDLHQHEPVYKTGASLFGHVGIKHECEESNPVRQVWRLPALPGAHSCKAPGLSTGAGSRLSSTSPARRSSTPR